MNIYDFYITPEEYEIALRNGISNYTLERRIRLYGWSKERALSEPSQKHNNRDKWLKIALKNGIKRSTFLGRINKYGWSEERAATILVIETSVKNRKYSDELYKTLEKNGISKTLFYDRIRKGWSKDRASTEKKFTQEDKTKLLLESNKNNSNYFKQMQDAHWLLRESRG